MSSSRPAERTEVDHKQDSSIRVNDLHNAWMGDLREPEPRRTRVEVHMGADPVE